MILWKKREKDYIYVYRGEPEHYDTSCRAGIFRKGFLDGNSFFEKSLFDTMRQNQQTSEKRYLDNAIDARHRVFPIRLLKVSYNCLTALYCAVMSYYHKDIDSLDDKEEFIVVFFG